MQRELAVIEVPAVVSIQVQRQLLLLSTSEMEMMKATYPELTIRWAEQEDRKQWAMSQALFTDPKGIATREMLVLPDEVQARFKNVRRRR